MESYFQQEFSIFLEMDESVDKAVNSLVKHAQGLFIWAATVCRMIEFSEGGSPREELEAILSSPSIVADRGLDLWDLYNQGLHRLNSQDSRYNTTVCQVLVVMAAMQHDLSSASFSKISGVEERDVKSVHRHLRAFYNMHQWKPNILSPLRLTTHSSFRYFLFATDSYSKIHHDFVIDPQHGHSTISQACHNFPSLPQTPRGAGCPFRKLPEFFFSRIHPHLLDVARLRTEETTPIRHYLEKTSTDSSMFDLLFSELGRGGFLRLFPLIQKESIICQGRPRWP